MDRNAVLQILNKGAATMQHFPSFMKNPQNRVPSSEQNTDDSDFAFVTSARSHSSRSGSKEMLNV